MTRRPAATGEVKPANTYTAKLVTSSVNDLCCIYESIINGRVRKCVVPLQGLSTRGGSRACVL